jgi:hypothetical protein
VLQQGEARALEEGTELAVVVLTPLAGERRAVAVGGGLALWAHDVVAAADAPRGEQRVASDLDPLRPRVVRDLAPACDVGGVLVLDVEAAAEGQDQHLEADLGALVDRRAHGLRLGAAHVHHQRVLGNPGGDGAQHAPAGQAAALALGRVVHQFEGAMALEARAGRQVLRGAARGLDDQQAGGLAAVVDLGRVVRVGAPVDDVPVGVRRMEAAEGEVGLDVQHVRARQRDALALLDPVRPLDDGQQLAREAVHRDRPVGVVVDDDPLAHHGQPVVELAVHRDAQAGERLG